MCAEELVDRAGQVMSADAAKWQQALNIWIARHREAVAEVRALQQEAEALHTALSEAVTYVAEGNVPDSEVLRTWKLLVG